MSTKLQLCCAESQSFPDGESYFKMCCIESGVGRGKDYWMDSDITNAHCCCSGYQKKSSSAYGGPPAVGATYTAPQQQAMPGQAAGGTVTGYPPKKV